MNAAVADLELPEAVYKTCPWQPRDLVTEGLRQWLRCCGAAMRDGQVIGMPSHAVDEAWHGLILCTARYSAFCDAAYGQFLHHHPEGGAPAGRPCVRSLDVIEACRGRIEVEPRRIPERVSLAINGLVSSDCIVLREGWIWLP